MSLDYSDRDTPSRRSKRRSNGVNEKDARGHHHASDDVPPDAALSGDDDSAEVTRPRDPSVWDDLEAIRSGIDAGRAKSRLLADLRDWLSREVDATGLVPRDPVGTPKVLAPLAALWKEIAGLSSAKKIRPTIQLILSACCQLVRPDGWLLAGEIDSKQETNALRSLAKTRAFRRLAEILLLRAKPRKFAKACRDRLDEALESDSAQLAVLRSDSSADSAHLAVDFNPTSMAIDWRLFGKKFFTGPWNHRVQIDRQQLPIDVTWQNVGTNSDEFGQYAEFRQQINSDVSIERVVFLSKETGFAVLLDTIRTTGSHHLRLEWDLPAGELSPFESIKDQRALYTRVKRGECRVIPLALPSLTVEPSPGGLTVETGTVRTWLEGHGQALAMPIAFCWHHKPLPEPRPWRHLTVTNDRRVVRRSEAVAYRLVHRGKHLVVYRSLLGTRRSSFIGHQTFYETMIGRIDSKGNMTGWLEVDGDPDTPWDYYSNSI